MALLASLPPTAGATPQGLVVRVVDSISGIPVPGALVSVLGRARAERTDRLGRSRFTAIVPGDSLRVAAIGYQPRIVAVPDRETEAQIELVPGPLTLAGLTVAPAAGTDLTPAATGGWVMPRRALDRVPPAVELDPLRALAIVPSVTFSTPLSARPLVRGYDAALSEVRIDGFEALNPFHVGRIFSAFPIDATEDITVTPLPALAADGGTLGGVIDIRGRSAGEPPHRAGVDVSPLSATGWWGGPPAQPVFAAVRAAWLGVATRLAGEGIPYDFQDGYGRARLHGAGHAIDVTLYGTHDDLGRGGGVSALWSNTLVGGRWRALDGPRGTVDLVASVNRSTLDGSELPARSSTIDARNRFTRLSVGLALERRIGPVAVQAGSTVGARRIENAIAVRSGDDFIPSTRDLRLTESQSFAQARWHVGRADVDLGLRFDRAGSTHAWQPRGRVALPLGQGLRLAVSAARAARPYQIVTDPQPEPTLAVVDLWLPVSVPDVPMPRVDHLAVELDRAGGTWTAQWAVYASLGRGLGEFRPVVDQRSGQPPIRFGDARTLGLEVRGSWRAGPGLGIVATYVLARSERRWDDGVWRPWQLDRRHTLRLQIEGALGRHWTAFVAAESQSGQPLTPVAAIVWRELPIVPGQTDSLRDPLPRYIFGPEGSARGGATARIDFGAQARLPGPWGSDLSVGVSLTNLAFGPVAPDEPASPIELLQQPARGVFYHRRFDLPAVPSVTLRLEF